MPHLIAALRDIAPLEAVSMLGDAHRFLVAQACAAVERVPTADPSWGVRMKRLEVDLEGPTRPSVVAKSTERFVEVINMVASLERLIAGIGWLAGQPEFATCRISVCHPSTSSHPGENDVVFADQTGRVVVRCEVCDVVSCGAGQNGKEKKDLRNLDCEMALPSDGPCVPLVTLPIVWPSASVIS